MKSLDTVAHGGGRRRSPHARLVPALDAGSVVIDGGLLHERMQVNRDNSLGHGLAELERGGNLHNLRVAAGRAEGYHPTLTLDADVHKWLEAAYWELGRAEDPELRAHATEVAELLAATQQSDGYLNSWFQAVEPERRLSDLTRGCEMYCAGHLMEAAVAAGRATGDRAPLEMATRFADLLDREFGAQGRDAIDGHEEVELALVELFRATGERRYLELARRFIDARGLGWVGPGVFGPRYYQDHTPVRTADNVTGHAVRAMYLATGAADVYLEAGDPELLTALERQWAAMVETKMYLTGGLGSRERDEAIGEPYELPPDRAYCETCAAAGLMFWNWRMLQATGEAKYGDLLERALYNAFLAGVSLDGREFFYANPLEVREGFEPPFESEWSGETPWYISPAPEQATARRRSWFRCACCPPNVMRVLSSLEQYLATVTADGVQLHQYARGSVEVEVGGERVRLEVDTDYPWDGRVTVRIAEAPQSEWTLSLRVPSWASGARVQVGDETGDVSPGTWSRTARWSAGDVVVLEMPMRARWTSPSPRASATYGCLAIERGPLVYCVEQADNPGIDLADIRVVPGAELQDRPMDLSPGMAGVTFMAQVETPEWTGFADLATSASEHVAPVQVTAVPYFAWSNRDEGAMRVWIPART